jgi:hypothetical protein
VAAEPQASAGTVVPSVVLVPVSVVVAKVHNSGRPKSLAFPNVDYFANSSSSVEVVGEEFVHSPTGDHANYGLYSMFSNPGLYQNKRLGHSCNNSSPGYNIVNDTNGLPIDATRSRSRKRVLHQCQEQRRHLYRVSLLTLAVREIQWGEANQYERLYLPVPWFEEEPQSPTLKRLFQKVAFSFCCLLVAQSQLGLHYLLP